MIHVLIMSRPLSPTCVGDRWRQRGFGDPLVVSCAAPVANLSAYLMATTWFRCSACRVVCSSRRYPECSAEDGNCVSTRLLSFRFPLLTSVPALIATLDAVPLATFVSMSHELLFFYGIGDVSSLEKVSMGILHFDELRCRRQWQIRQVTIRA